MPLLAGTMVLARFLPLAPVLAAVLPALHPAAQAQPAGMSRPTLPADAAATPGSLLYRDDFTDPDTLATHWVVEQQPGGTVAVEDGKLVIRDQGGCTVWFRFPLQAPVMISYRATVRSDARVSDLNCFWMASDPDHPDDLFAAGHGRTGAFATYDPLQLYYVGYGGNTNSTTRFRRYAGDGTKVLQPEYDLKAPQFMLQPDHTYEVVLIAAIGHAQYIRDGERIFDFEDPEPLTKGWFGLRTVQSHVEISDFRVWEAKPVPVQPAPAATTPTS